MLETGEKKQSGEREAHESKNNKSGKEVSVNAGTSLPLSYMEEIESVASRHHVRKAKVLRQFVLRGLAAYHRDGLLEEPADTLHIEE